MGEQPSRFAVLDPPRVLAFCLGIAVAALSISVLAGWLLDIAVLRSALDRGVPMRANVAASLIVAGGVLAALALGRLERLLRPVALVAGVAVAMLAFLTLMQDLAGLNFGIDEWLVRDTTGSAAVSAPGRMSPPTALSLTLLGIGLAVASRPPGARLRATVLGALGAAVLLIGGIAVLGHILEHLFEVRFLGYSRIALYTAVALALSAAALLALLRAEGGLHWSLERVTTAGFAAGIAAMVLSASVAYEFTTRMRADAVQVSRTLELLRGIQKMNALLGEFTISAGRYVITRDERTLDAREATKAAIVESLGAVRRRTLDLPVQRARLDRIVELHARRVDMSEAIIADFRRRIREGRLPGPGDPSPLGQEYPALGYEIEHVARAMEADEDARLERAQRAASATSAETFLLLPLGTLFGLAILSFGLFLLNAAAGERMRLTARAQKADSHYRLLFENVPVGVTITGPDGGILSANEVAARMFGYDSIGEAVAALRNDASRVYAEPDALVAYLRGLREHGTVKGMEAELVRRDGSRFWASVDGKLIPDPGGASALLVSIVDDISLRREQARRIARLNRMKDMRGQINAAVARIRERRPFLQDVCRVAVAVGGLKAAWVAWHDPERRALLPAASAGEIREFLAGVSLHTDVAEGPRASIAVAVLKGGASIVTNDVRHAPRIAYREEALKHGFLAAMHLPLAIEGVVVGVLVLLAAERGAFDDEERRLLDELAGDISVALDSIEKTVRLDYLAYYDPVTGLPNRTLFQDRLARSLRLRGGDARLVAVVLLDLERFRQVNETLGRQQGDELLRGVGGRLQRSGESAARIGSDMFGLTLRGARDAAEVNRAVEAVLAATFSAPFPLHGEDLLVAGRAGVAIFPDDGADADVLMRNAEAALRRSKTAGERIAFYSPDMNARVAESLALENRLRRAVEQRQFVLHYQPKVKLEGGGVAGAEALIRWQVPGGELVPPGRFIPLLEETGLIVEVGRWAVAQAFRDLNAWANKGLQVPRIAVNVSALQLQRKDFVDAMIEEIEQGGDHPEWLELEITEGLVMRNVEDATRKLSILRGMGVTVAIDDFGTGYSSLGYLSRLPVDSLKIDRSFILGMASGEQGRNIVTTIIALAAGLKLKVVAEGVETEEQAGQLRSFGCDEAQGYLFSRPLPADAMAEFLAGKAPK
ncbi:MAG: EAL domain-containing protein [Betaproteobacteria bacterium]